MESKDQQTSTTKLTVNVFKTTLHTYICQSSLMGLFTIILSFVCALHYVLVEALLYPLFLWLRQLLPAEWRLNYFASNKYFIDYCTTLTPEGHKNGVIKQYTCSKTGRTYVIRVLDSERDILDAASVLSAGFAKDPFNSDLFGNINKKHMLTAPWHFLNLSSPSVNVVVQEWVEEEKIVGVMVFSESPPNLWSTFVDDVLTCLFFIRSIGILSITDIHRILLVTLGLNYRYSQMCDTYGHRLGLIKFLAVEKGFQGQGIGSSLLHVATDYFDVKNIMSYIESSHADNIRLYKRFDYHEFEQFHPCPDFSPLYLMLRQARTT